MVSLCAFNDRNVVVGTANVGCRSYKLFSYISTNSYILHVVVIVRYCDSSRYVRMVFLFQARQKIITISYYTFLVQTCTFVILNSCYNDIQISGSKIKNLIYYITLPMTNIRNTFILIVLHIISTKSNTFRLFQELNI